MKQAESEENLDTKAAAALLGCHPQTLKARRFAGYQGEPGPPWFYLFERTVRYKRSDVLAYAAQRRTLKPPGRIPAPPAR